MWQNPQDTADLVTFTEETLNEKLHFLCSDRVWILSLFFGMVKKSKSKCVVLKKLQNYFLLHFKNIRLSRITLTKREFTTIFKLRTKYLRMG